MPAHPARLLGLTALLGIAAVAACSGPSPQGPSTSVVPAASVDRNVGPRAIDGFIYFEAPVNYESKPAKSVEFEIKDFAFATKAVNLTRGGDCKNMSGGLLCVIPEDLPMRSTYTIIVKTYNKPFPSASPKPPPGAVKLSENTVFVSKWTGVWKTHVVIYEPPKSIFVTGESPDITGSQKTGFILSGPLASGSPAPFEIQGLDRYGRYVVGPGSPTFKISSSSPSVKIQYRVGGQSWSLSDLPGAPSSTIITAKIPACARCTTHFTVEDVATPTPSPSPSPSPSPTPTPTIEPPAIFVTYSKSTTAGAVYIYDEEGRSRTISGNWAGSGKPMSFVWDPHIVWFYLTAGDTGTGTQTTVQVYDQNGDHLPSFVFPETQAMALTVDSHLNRIYVTGNGAVRAYGEDGGSPITLNPGFPTPMLTSPYGLAFDANLNDFFIANAATGKVEKYDEIGNAISLGINAFTRPPSCSSCPPYSIAVDPNDANDIFVEWAGSSSGPVVSAYDENGNSVSLSGNFSGITSPGAIVPDTHNGFLYVTTGTNVKVYNSQGVQQTTLGTFTPGGTVQSANGIAIIPPT
jgi:hypothetical protein